ncbi:transglutaminase domain-containing protein [Cellulosilyticum lentocellum]|uniref:Transglutaminase domain-containing protein n=1 Tax=Cellulosilyticum lentocellum (strain ATCC 49066 / DSM 5427 / NCIMB 11756 / RHM5) TaxID=642492 RepID=F2JQ87_CELLD|nr:transglutaminase-like domain-containing protein [Cellulosilyticum lentocellum]ADZ83749.1 transglutaminase domain-containing protein [Cellulosilyticum lentocellum DSM 5427]
MGKKQYVKGILLSLLVSLWLCTGLYAQTNLMTSVPCDGKSYTIQFSGDKALLSRDGSLAVPVVSGTKITKPGTYYLSVYEATGLRVETFKIKSQTKSSWAITKESDLNEAIKSCLENYQKSVTINFKYQTSMDQVETILSKHIQEVTDTYPMLMIQNYYGKLSQDSKGNLSAQVNFKYPLQVTNTLKKYDTQALSGMANMVNTLVKPYMKDYEIEQALLMGLMNRVTYSLHEDASINATSMTHTLQGAFIGEKKIVCDGYAKTFMHLMNMVGVPTQLITGTSTDRLGESVGHAWNLIKIQGAYYHVDSTWADQHFETLGLYDYINEQDTYMAQDHVWDKSRYPKAVTLTYTFPNSPVSVSQVTKVASPNELEAGIEKVKSQQKGNGTLILQKQSQWHWDEEEVAEQLYEVLDESYSCYSEEKYDCVMIYYLKEE